MLRNEFKLPILKCIFRNINNFQDNEFFMLK